MSTLSWCAALDMRGVVMQEAQSMVGKTLERAIILPPMLGSFSTTSTLRPRSARSSEVWRPAMPPPMTRTS